jgi:translation initiation factor 3 subunit C
MSRFFRGGDESSSESSSDEEELYSTSEEEEEKEEQEESSSEEEEEEESSDDEPGPAKAGLSRFLVDNDSDSDESDVEGATKVKSAKDKRFDELDATITTIHNGQKINDWGSIANGMCFVLGPNPPAVSNRI